MSVPDYQTLMLPVLRLAGDGREHAVATTRDALASELGLGEEDRRELLSSGRQSKFDNRVRWAITYLKKARVLRSTGRGRFIITERGNEILQNPPSKITVAFLRQFSEFVEFRTPRKEADESRTDVSVSEDQREETPEEAIEAAYQQLRETLGQELIQRVSECSPRFFELLVLDLLVAMGYGGSRRDAAQAVGQSGDEGVDGIIKEDRLGLDVVYVQAKRWTGTVGRPVVQAFAGSLEGYRARKGILITTSAFSEAAHEYVKNIEKRIVLIDGENLAELMIDYSIGVTDVDTYTMKKVDSDYFEDGM